MRVDEIAERYYIEQKLIEEVLAFIDYPYNLAPFSGIKVVKDEDVEMILERSKGFYQEFEQRKREEEKRRIEAEKIAKQQRKAAEHRQKELQDAFPNILITSAAGFEGYRIVKYSGFISGDAVTEVNQGMMKSLAEIRRDAVRELKEAAFDLGFNAVIGIDFDYITFGYALAVTVNGNAVVIEKIEN